MQRLTDLTKGLVGLLATFILLIGVPVGLIITVGWPLPTRWPGLDTVSRHLASGDIPDTFIIKFIAVIIWIAWAQLIIATVSEYLSILGGKVTARTPAMPGVRLLAAKLATWTSLVISAVAPITPVAAAPLHSVAPVVEIPQALPFGTIHGGDTTQTEMGESRAVAEERYRTVRGDTWWDISEQLMGDGMRWDEIRTMNLDTRMPDGETITSSTDTVKPGWFLVVPLAANLPENQTQASDDLSSDTTDPSDGTNAEVTVEKGDHFWATSKEALAEAWGREPTNAELTPYWLEMVAANEDRLLPPEDPNLIYPDQVFLLPDMHSNPDLAVDLNGSSVLDPPFSSAAIPALEPLNDVESTGSPEAETPVSEESSLPVQPEQREPSTIPTAPPRAIESPSSPQEDAGLGDFVEDAKPIVAVAAGIGLLGAMLAFTLRRLRGIQAARRRPGTTIDAPDDEAAEFEQRIRSISTDGEDVRYIAAANSYLSHILEEAATPIPSVIAVRAGQFGLEFLLDEPCEPIMGFHAATPDKTAWRLNADLDVRMMEGKVVGDSHPFAPALCVVGSTEAGSLLVDLEQLGAVSIEGDPKDVANFQRGLLASVCVAPWATECEIVTLGVDGLSGEHLSRATTPDDPAAWAEATAITMRQIASNLDRSPYEERIGHGTVYHPTIVFVGPDESLAGVAQHLAPVAELAHAPLVVVSAHPLASEYRFPLESGSGTLEPLGLTFQPVSLDPAELAAVDRLVANASDTATSPPTDDWANEIAGSDEVNVNGSSETNGVASINGKSATLKGANGSSVMVEEATQDPSKETMEAIEEILRPRPVEVTILGRHPRIVGLDGEVTAKIEAIITYLAFHREVAGQRLRDEFWPGSTSRQACDNAIGRARALLGVGKDGESRLVTLRATHSYAVSDDVGLDWHRVERLAAAAKGQGPADEAAYLDAACELIEGRVAADARPANYGWLLREPTIYTLVETTLVDAAHRRGELALVVGDVERANWAARKGLTVVEGQEAMYRMKMEAEAEAGNIDGVKAAYREAQRAAESYGYDHEVQPETQALFERLSVLHREPAP